jgi:Tfp pilus assembly protein PilN
MINLLPPQMKQDFRYARRNRRLVLWSLAMLLAIIGVSILTVTGTMIMNRKIAVHQADLTQTQARLANQNTAEVQQQVTAISSNLKLMVRVLSREVLFSKLLVQLGNTTPTNVVLTNLSISQSVSAIDITARTKNYSGAAQLQANLTDPQNKIFSKADIVSISCSTTVTEGALASYPCTVTIKALFAADNPFLFLNTDKAAQ